MTGIRACSHATAVAPSIGCRMAMMSAYPETTLTVSARVSPLVVEEVPASEKPMTLPPRDSIADSKLRRVRVDGSKKSVASVRCRSASSYFSGCFAISSAVSIRESISFTERSRISITFFIVLTLRSNSHPRGCCGMRSAGGCPPGQYNLLRLPFPQPYQNPSG